MSQGFVSPVPLPLRSELRRAITAAYLVAEEQLLPRLIELADAGEPLRQAAVAQAAAWVREVRAARDGQSPFDRFMREYDLGSEEGVVLMCLAEALQRIPDAETAEKLIADKLADADWEAHLGKSDSVFVNASTWGLMLTGRLVRLPAAATGSVGSALGRMVGRSSEPVIRMAIGQAMKLMAHQFVLGRDIGEALKTAAKSAAPGAHSFDMLGEAALTSADAQHYFDAYRKAIAAIGAHVAASPALAAASIHARPSISVKLSALHPRYELAQRQRVLQELVPMLLDLALDARRHGIGLTVDAEEADRLELSLDVFEAVYLNPQLDGWVGMGLAVQAFQKRSLAVVEYLIDLATRGGRALAVRLVKGAYWDTEIKRAQEQGLASYPVFTRKLNTDVAYLACARRLLAAGDCIYPMFATHNAHTIAAVQAMAGAATAYEFQRLHGMGEALHREAARVHGRICRVYAPVGSHRDLLPYLVRRLLENGANTSFVNRLMDEAVAAEQLVADPLERARAQTSVVNPQLALPADLFAGQRANSAGIALSCEAELGRLSTQLAAARPPTAVHSLIVDEQPAAHLAARPVTAPANRDQQLGEWRPLDPAHGPAVVQAAAAAFSAWSTRPLAQRAACLRDAAKLFAEQQNEMLALLMTEAGKTLADAVAEWREAVDFLHYYAAAAERLATPQAMPGPTGETNALSLHGRGVFVCISPWNFPLAIFVGQLAAALVMGNTVVAKPAEQTNLIAVLAVRLLHRAGVPVGVLQCVLGAGEVGAALVAQPAVAGVAFTGSVAVAQAINRALAARPGPIATLIAETGGQNAMIVDSSALPEQVVKDAIHSAFGSAGQRCSALRILLLQDEIAERCTRMLAGAMQELVIGDPRWLSTDIGPVIDAEAQQRLLQHIEQMQRTGRPIAALSPPASCARGNFVGPCAVELESLSQLDDEYFGPVLHVLRYPARRLEQVVEQINATGFGLTMGVHSRIESTWRSVQRRARVGNLYINRGMTGAVVGSQPFGGEGLSGTGPKAGGPHYLLRFATERMLTVNTSAVGGNARLLASDD